MIPNELTLAGAVTWRADGRLTGRSFGNGLRETRTYDTRGQLRTQQLGTEVTTYAYNPAGNLLARSRPGADHAWDYDALDRVTGDRLDARARSYTYDANHNRRDALIEGIPEAYSYAPASNRLTAIATPSASQTLAQDAAGNLLDDGAGQTYAYNQAGRLASAETAAGITRYRYSALGLRTHKQGTTTTVFHHDAGGRLLAETTADGTLIRSYVWFGDEPLAQFDGPLGSETPTYLHTDHLATPRLGTDQAGIPVWRWESPAFGDAAPSLQLRTVNLRFPGQYFDAETGLHQNGHRDYDPRIGRYLQSDPIGLAAGLNTYVYIGGNPLRGIDPLGLYQMCHRDLQLPIPYARHCYARFDDGSTSSFDPNGVNPDPDPNQSGTTCTNPIEPEKDDCIKKAMQRCKGSNYDFTAFNCCHCVEQALKECGTSIPPSSWPNWPINPGPQPGEPRYSPNPAYGPELGK